MSHPHGAGAPRIYRVLMRLYPRVFRERYGAAMTQLAADELRTAAGRSARERRRIWRSLAADLARSLAREHAAALGEWRAGFAPRPTATTSAAPYTHGDTMGTLLQDVRYAARTLRRSLGFAAIVVCSLALGIGANTLIYSVVDGVVLRPFAYPDAGRLVAVGVTFPKLSGERSFIEVLSPPELEDIRGGNRSLHRFTAFDLGNRNISGGDRPERVFTAFVWGDPFATIGLRPALGRGFHDDETTKPGPRVAVLSWRIWQTRFGADSGVVGRAIEVNGEPVTVVGIMPATLLLLGTDLWLPMAVSPSVIPRQARQFNLIARVGDGATLAQVNAELSTIARRVETQYVAERAEYAGWRLEALPWSEALLEPVRAAAFIMLGAVVFVLLIACANIAGLMLARAAARQREIAVRRALGAAGWRIARQLFTESILLALLGAALGTGLAAVLLRPVLGLFPERVTQLGVEATLNARVLGVTLLAAVASGLLFGLAPAIQLARNGGTGWLTGEGGRLTIGVTGRRLRQGFTVVQIALALVLLAGAGLLLRSFQRLQQIDAGFDTGGVLTMRLSLPREKYMQDRIASFFEDLSVRLEGVPGVVRAAAATQFPPVNGFSARLGLEGETAGADARVVDITNATERFFATLGYSLRRGRVFAPQDGEQSPRVAVLNETAARRFFPEQNPVGRRIRLGEGEQAVWREVIGVVGDARNRGLDAPVAPEVFVPVKQQDVAWNNQLFLLIRTRTEPMTVLPAIRAAIAALDPDQPVYAITTLEGAFAESSAQRRAAMILLAVFAGVALALAAVGIYGVLSQLVIERRHEIGIRMALGAAAGDVVALVLRQTLLLIALGTAIGLAGALALGKTLSSLVFEIQPRDPATLAGVAVVLALTGLVAGLVPARRATQVAPVEALRT